MSKLKYNVIANLFGKGCVAFSSITFVPLYIRFLGVEAYGLVGFYVSLQSILSLLDLGFSIALNREISILTAREDTVQESRNLVRSLEVIYWTIALAIIALMFLVVSPWLASTWFKAELLSSAEIRSALSAIGLAIAFRFPFFLYYGGLLGLEKLVQLNVLTGTTEILKGIGAVIVLSAVSPTINAFFIWQTIITLLQTILAAILLWQFLPKSVSRSRFQIKSVTKILKFATGMTAVSASGVLLVQIDKIILSNMLPLENFSYYTISTTLGYVPHTLVMYPIYSAVFPRFTRLICKENRAELVSAYHKTSQFASVCVISVSLVLALFSQEIVLLWTGDVTLAGKIHLLVSLITLGTMMHSLVHTPYAIQFAHGRTKLVFLANVISLVAVFPLLTWLTSLYGFLSGAITWFLLNVGYLFILVQLIHKRSMVDENKSWYYEDTLAPFVAILLFTLAARFAFPSSLSLPLQALCLFVISLVAFAIGCMAAPYPRRWVAQLLNFY